MSVFIRPWKGKDYESTRLLLLGESMYGSDPDGVQDNVLIWMIENTLSGDWKKRNNFYKKVYRVVTNRLWRDATPAERTAFWNRVAFLNFVQRPVLGGPRSRPSREMWVQSESTFRTEFERLRPAGVVVLGKTVWSYLAEVGIATNLEPGAYQVVTAGHACPAVFINHPSYSRLSADQRRLDLDDGQPVRRPV